MSHSIGCFYHETEYNLASLFNTYVSIIQYMFVKYYLRFVVLNPNEDFCKRY